jgi:hypothetical protein
MATAADAAAAERAAAVTAAHVVRAFALDQADGGRGFAAAFPELAGGDPPPRRGIVARLRSRPKPDEHVRGAAERAFAQASGAGRAPGSVDVVAALLEDPVIRRDLTAAGIPAASIRTWAQTREEAA